MKLLEVVEQQLKISNEARSIKIFKKLIERDKHRDKPTAIAELMFIYCMCDYRSSYNNYSDNEKQLRIVKDIMPPAWKPDELVRECMSFYLEHQKTPSLKALAESKEALLASTNMLTILRRVVSNQMDTLNLALASGDEEEYNIGLQAAALENIEAINKLTKSIPTIVTTVEQLEEKVKKEQASGTRVRGGGELNSREV